MPIKGALFDQDGTLLDTETLSTEAIRAVIAPYGGTCEWSLKRRLLGLRTPAWTAIVVADQGLAGRLSAEELGARWAAYLSDKVPQRLPGALEVVRLLRASGLKEALCTSAPRAVTAFRGEHERELFANFDAVLTAEDVTKGKPDPEIYLRGAERLGLAPSECVVFEDALPGVRAGKAAGCFVVAVPDVRMKDEFVGEADVVLTSLTEFTLDMLPE